MKPARPELPEFNFMRTFVGPALLVFLIPVFSWWFFQHVQADFDAQVLASIEKSIDADKEVTEEKRSRARAFYRAHPASELLASNDPKGADLRKGLNGTVVFNYAVFRWMILLADMLNMLGLEDKPREKIYRLKQEPSDPNLDW